MLVTVSMNKAKYGVSDTLGLQRAGGCCYFVWGGQERNWGSRFCGDLEGHSRQRAKALKGKLSGPIWGKSGMVEGTGTRSWGTGLSFWFCYWFPLVLGAGKTATWFWKCVGRIDCWGLVPALPVINWMGWTTSLTSLFFNFSICKPGAILILHALFGSITWVDSHTAPKPAADTLWAQFDVSYFY